MYYSTVINTILMTLGSLVATKYFDVINQMTVPLILTGTVTLVMNQGVMNGVRTQEKIVFILSLLAIGWIIFQNQTQQPRDLSTYFTLIALFTNVLVVSSYLKKVYFK